MLSILIPVYNWDIRKLVSELQRQCLETKIGFEILCFDDGSKADFKEINREVVALEKVNYHELKENQGRSRIRNTLAKAAKFDYLLFMDCDSGVVSDQYIQNYIKKLNPDTLLYGGRVYQENVPSEEYLFHWTYGKTREQAPPEQRTLHPYHSFMTNNFLVPKKIFVKFPFDENLRQYGHEDTLFGLQLKSAGVPIVHLDNPLQHEGLEITDQFLKKTRQGIENLYYLSKKYKVLDTRLLRVFKKLDSYRLAPLVLMVFRFFQKRLINNFNSQQPNLKLFDFYKLGYLIQVSRRPT